MRLATTYLTDGIVTNQDGQSFSLETGEARFLFETVKFIDQKRSIGMDRGWTELNVAFRDTSSNLWRHFSIFTQVHYLPADEHAIRRADGGGLPSFRDVRVTIPEDSFLLDYIPANAPEIAIGPDRGVDLRAAETDSGFLVRLDQIGGFREASSRAEAGIPLEYDIPLSDLLFLPAPVYTETDILPCAAPYVWINSLSGPIGDIPGFTPSPITVEERAV